MRTYIRQHKSDSDHGSPSHKEEYQSFLKILEDLNSKISAEIKIGKTEKGVTKNDILSKNYDDLGNGTGFSNSENIRRTFFTSLKVYLFLKNHYTN